MDNSINKYAPVFIPTLCRYCHFKECLDSLEHCIDADKTSVFIALDYPLKESHWEGYRKIDDYLRAKELTNCFGELIVVRRKHNFGLGKNSLREMIFEKYDRMICSEDDNVFAPNFLLFMNGAFNIAEKNDKIYAVNGYSYPFDYKFKGNTYCYDSLYCAWGTGVFRDRRQIVTNDLDNGFMKKSLSIKNYLKIRKCGFYFLHCYIFCVIRDIGHSKYRKTDIVITLYLILKGMYAIKPSNSTVKNLGWDLSGDSFKHGMTAAQKQIAIRHFEQELGNDSSFNFKGDPMSYFDDNNYTTFHSGEWPMTYWKYVSDVVLEMIGGVIRKTRKIILNLCRHFA